MQRKRLLTVGLALVLTLTVVGVAYSQVSVTGYVLFKPDTTMAQALALMEAHNVTLVRYTSAQNDAGIGVGDDFEGVFNHDSLKDDFWKGYAKVLDNQLEFIARTDANPRFSKYAKWPAQKQGILDEIVRFEANEDGCWNNATCPSFLVEEIEIRAPIATMQAMEGESIILEIGWAAKYLFVAQQENPPVSEWVPNAVTIKGAQDTGDARTLDMEFGWDGPGDLKFLKSDSTVLRMGLRLTVEGGTYFTTTNTFTGHPQMLEQWSHNGIPRPYRPLRSAFSGGGHSSWSFGSLQAENFEPEFIYQAHFLYAKGSADTDEGNLGIQTGTRSCRLLFCITWAKGLLLEAAKIVMPGTSEYELLPERFVYLPTIMNRAVSSRGESNRPQ